MAKLREKVVVYLSPELKQQVQQAAESDRRSTSAWVEVTLKDALKQQQQAS